MFNLSLQSLAKQAGTGAAIIRHPSAAFLIQQRLDSPIMSDLNRGIMKFKGADSPLAVGLSSAIILGSIGFLIWWALQSAYTLG